MSKSDDNVVLPVFGLQPLVSLAVELLKGCRQPIYSDAVADADIDDLVLHSARGYPRPVLDVDGLGKFIKH